MSKQQAVPANSPNQLSGESLNIQMINTKSGDLGVQSSNFASRDLIRSPYELGQFSDSLEKPEIHEQKPSAHLKWSSNFPDKNSKISKSYCAESKIVAREDHNSSN